VLAACPIPQAPRRGAAREDAARAGEQGGAEGHRILSGRGGAFSTKLSVKKAFCEWLTERQTPIERRCRRLMRDAPRSEA